MSSEWPFSCWTRIVTSPIFSCYRLRWRIVWRILLSAMGMWWRIVCLCSYRLCVTKISIKTECIRNPSPSSPRTPHMQSRPNWSPRSNDPSTSSIPLKTNSRSKSASKASSSLKRSWSKNKTTTTTSCKYPSKTEISVWWISRHMSISTPMGVRSCIFMCRAVSSMRPRWTWSTRTMAWKVKVRSSKVGKVVRSSSRTSLQILVKIPHNWKPPSRVTSRGRSTTRSKIKATSTSPALAMTRISRSSASSWMSRISRNLNKDPTDPVTHPKTTEILPCLTSRTKRSPAP